jgi:hypothetical protein
MQRWVIRFAATLAVSFAGTLSQAQELRTDGVYYLVTYPNPMKPEAPIHTYVRFFAGGSGKMVHSADKPEEVARWLTRDGKAGVAGSYRTSGNVVTLVIPTPTGQITYEATPTSDGLAIGSRKYAFLPAAAETPDPGVPIVAGRTDVHNQIQMNQRAERVGVTTTVEIDATDPQGGTLSFDWAASNGTLVSASGRKVIWRRPIDMGRTAMGILVVDVRNDKGAKTSRAWVMY